MVDVTGKSPTARVAVARCVVHTAVDVEQVFASVEHDPTVDAVVAGIQAAKLTSQLIPLCHPILLSDIEVAVTARQGAADIVARTQVVDRTGVEMEALVACATAGLAIVMSLRELDPDATIEGLALWHKSGGRSGTWDRRPEEQATPVGPDNLANPT
jgi:cyclic pyranopterin phosphate synthase